MRTTVHAMPVRGEHRERLRKAAYDRSLAHKHRQQAASLLLTSTIPGMVSEAEVDQFFIDIIAATEASLFA